MLFCCKDFKNFSMTMTNREILMFELNSQTTCREEAEQLWLKKYLFFSLLFPEQLN